MNHHIMSLGYGGGVLQYAIGAKKMLNIYIFEILKKHSDSTHRLLQQDIIDILKRDYQMDCERKAVSRNINALMEFGYEIENNKGYYLAERDFEDSELRLLIDSLLSSKHIPTQQCKQLIEKLRKQSNKYFSHKVRHVINLPELEHTDNKQLFYTIDILDEAIENNKKVTFFYNEYGLDKKLHPKRTEKYIVNPYQMVVANGRYYLIGNYDKYDNISHYRLDKITEIEVLDGIAKSIKKVNGLSDGFHLPKHMAEHIYMFGGESANILLSVQKDMIGEIIDWFGKDFRIMNDNGNSLDIKIKANENAIYYWAMQYCRFIEILEPKSLRDRIKETFVESCEKYK